MAVGLPLKTTYADGDVYSASDVNDTNGTVNLVGQTNNFYAAKNKIINGNFAINQRNFTSATINNTYGFDRWVLQSGGDGSVTYTPQNFTAGAAPVAGYEARNYARVVTATQLLSYSYAALVQKIESVRTFAGQTVTLSFWAQAGSGTPKVALAFDQNFGTGGSPSGAVTTTAGTVTLSTSWTRYSVTVAMPSISGKTIGTTTDGSVDVYLITTAGSSYAGIGQGIGLQNATINFWGVQLESGSTATAFQTATGTTQGELAACQRYYWRSSDTSSYANYGIAYAVQTNSLYASIKLPVTMRIRPTSVDYSTLGAHLYNISVAALSSVTLDTSSTSADWGVVLGATTGLTQFRPYGLNNNNSTSGYIGFSAEL